jgi:prephenate dehydrogenase
MMLPEILDRIHSGASALDKKIVIDVCSTKEHICAAVKYHPARKQYVCTHPMAGTEYSGPWAAQPGLFDGRACIFADQEESAPWAVQDILELYSCLNMRPIFMSSSSHDVHTAYVSHISHVTSFALALTVLDKEKDEKHIFDLASGGFSSTVRLAKSNADMWIPILTQNHNNVLQVMDTYIEKMQQFREAVASYDEDALRKLIEDANKIKRIIR